MAYRIRFEDQARKELAALDNSAKTKILKYLKKLEERNDPRSLGKALTENCQATGDIVLAIIASSRR